MTDAPILQITALRYRWPGRAGFGLALDDLTLARGETVLLLGESGSGKSTLLSLICGTLRADSGEIRVNGCDMTALPAAKRDRYRAEDIGVIFQQFNLLPFGSVLDNILLPLRFAPDRRKRAGDPRATARALVQGLGLTADLLPQRAGTLSVGQQQRVAVARALIGQPPLLIADEPTSALDADTQAAFLDLMFEQLRASGASLLMVSHDARLGERFDRVLKIEEIARIERPAA